MLFNCPPINKISWSPGAHSSLKLHRHHTCLLTTNNLLSKQQQQQQHSFPSKHIRSLHISSKFSGGTSDQSVSEPVSCLEFSMFYSCSYSPGYCCPCCVGHGAPSGTTLDPGPSCQAMNCWRESQQPSLRLCF